MDFSQKELMEWVLIPLFIFAARICDVSLDTIRIINVNGNNRVAAATLGFFQVMIWLLAVQQIMQNLSNFYYYFFYAAGFAGGNFVGLFIQDKLVKGIVLVRVIADYNLNELSEKLRLQSIKSTQLEGTTSGLDQKTHILMIISNRKKTDKVVNIIEQTTPGVFYSIQDIRYATEDNLNKLFSIDNRVRAFLKSKRLPDIHPN